MASGSIELTHFDDKIPVIYKVLLVGNCKVGKSCILNRYCENEFSATYIPTVGVEFRSRLISSLGRKLKLSIWDASGTSLSVVSHWEKVTRFAGAATGIIFIYDISNKESFLAIPKWQTALENHIDSSKVQQYLIGNKSDLEKQRAVSRDQGTELSMEKQMRFFETSAKLEQDKEITSAFLTLIHDMKLQYDEEYSNNYQKLEVKVEEPVTYSNRCLKLFSCCSCFGRRPSSNGDKRKKEN